jgi:methionyl-tRNA formyltransferase
MRKLRCVFFGSGPVAEQSLQLLTGLFDLEAIVTKPSTGASMRRLSSETRVYEVKNRQELDQLIEQVPFTSEIAILIDFGVIISRRTIDAFRLGILNSHFSLLPQWRGPDPITFAILSGQAVTGVTLMLLVELMDQGPILAQAPCPIEPDATTPSLTNQLIAISASMIETVVPEYAAGNMVAIPQKEGSLLEDRTPTYSRRLTKLDGALVWTKSALQIEREIRAFAGWPKSYTRLARKSVTITKVHITEMSGRPGKVIVDGKRLIICCSEGAIEVLRLKPEGKPEMSSEAFLAGYKASLEA